MTNNSHKIHHVLLIRLNIIHPELILSQGNVDYDLNFEFGDGTNIRYGCGATLMGEMWYFGGNENLQVCNSCSYIQ